MKTNYKSLILIIIAIFTLISAVWGGLLRLGWLLPIANTQLIIFHGPLMVCGFLGTLVSMERSIALGKKWAAMAPIFTGIGSLMLIFGFPVLAGQVLILTGSIFLFAIFIHILGLQKSLHTYVMIFGVFCWIVGNILWLSGFSISFLVLWWISFVLMTISGERLELARLGNITKKNKNSFIISLLVILSGLISTFYSFDTGIKIFGAGLILFTLWLSKYDIARRTVKTKGITKYIALCLLSGYFWLGLSGTIALFYGVGITSNFLYDSFLHSFFLGFTFSMILGHAPIIIPAVLKINLNFKNSFYIPLILLHLSLALRIYGGLAGENGILKTAGLLNAFTLLIFFLNILISIKFFEKVKVKSLITK